MICEAKQSVRHTSLLDADTASLRFSPAIKPGIVPILKGRVQDYSAIDISVCTSAHRSLLTTQPCRRSLANRLKLDDVPARHISNR